MQKIFILLSIIALFFACQQKKATMPATQKPINTSNIIEKQAPDWYKNAILYEVNVRNYTPQGTLNAFSYHLPRLKELGVDVLWLMPIYPISQIKRKGSLGSPYAIADYRMVNPELGTMADLDSVIVRAHRLGMKVILDYVPNHTGWDHSWIKSHPEWYTHAHDSIIHPSDNDGKPTNWFDVADLNYDSRELRAEVIDILKYWVREHDIDGYRMDVAGFVPNDFWEEVRPALQAIKPVFMLSEWEDVPQHFESCFEVNYGWAFHHLINDIAQGKKNATDLDKHYEAVKTKFPSGASQLLFITNHDENTWNGTEFKRMGAAKNAMAALTFTFDGMPLIYSGQEVENKKQLPFFERNAIDFPNLNHQHSIFYQKLAFLKHRNQALWNAPHGAAIQKIKIEGNEKEIYAFYREKEDDRVVCIFNMSNKPVKSKIIGSGAEGQYTEVLSGMTYSITQNMPISLPPWGFWILERNK